MPIKLGSTNVTLKLGTQSVTARLGSTLVSGATVPGAPTITRAESGNTAAWSAPSSDGGSAITAYKFYVNGIWDTAGYGPNNFESVDVVFVGEVIQVSAVNAVGEGPKSAPVTVT